jgi:hypothetical protein
VFPLEGRLLGLPANAGKGFAWNKCSSLFGVVISVEEKMFCNIDRRGLPNILHQKCELHHWNLQPDKPGFPCQCVGIGGGSSPGPSVIKLFVRKLRFFVISYSVCHW